MLPSSIIANIIFICTVLSLASEVYTQKASDDSGQPDRFRPCAAWHNCTPIQRCHLFRYDWQRQGVGITCGQGSGIYRRVCCPKLQIPSIDGKTKGGCGENQGVFTQYIFGAGGSNASEGTWPWMVAIRIREDSGIYTPWCSGFLIDRIHVLSAAHCFEKIEDGLYTTLIGSVDQEKAKEYPVSRIKLHEGWREGFHYDDIAILTLARGVNVPNFMPICLPDDRILGIDLNLRVTTVAGWGSDRAYGPLSRFLVQVMGIPVVSNKKCSEIYTEELNSFRRQFPRGLTRGIMCAGLHEGGKDACGGDSGGPLMLRESNHWFAIGIVSFGYLCGEPGIPSGYTRISTYLDWIEENTKNESSDIARHH